MIKLNKNEEIYDLMLKGSKIIQNTTLYNFNSDSIFLANYAKFKENSKILEIGSGVGVISILLALKNKNLNIDAIEIQQVYFDLLERNIKLNKLEKNIKALNVDFNNFKTNIKYDVIITNPPYYKLGSGHLKGNDYIDIARHEIKLNIRDLISKSSKLLRTKGEFFLVHKVFRLQEILSILEENRLKASNLLLIKSKLKNDFDIFVLRAIKDGKNELKINDLTVYDENNNYTKEALKFYE